MTAKTLIRVPNLTLYILYLSLYNLMKSLWDLLQVKPEVSRYLPYQDIVFQKAKYQIIATRQVIYIKDVNNENELKLKLI